MKKGKPRKVATSGGMVAAIYARVSKDDQNYEMQLRELRAYARRQDWQVLEYLEKESSVKKRPVFEGMLDDARRGKFGVILVWRIDRWARSMKDFVYTTLQLDTWKVGLISTTESVDTRDQNPFAEFQRGLLALLAQLERKIIVARVSAGVAEYRRAFDEGKIGKNKSRHSRSGKDKAVGRPKAIFRRDLVAQMRHDGVSWRKIALKLGVPVSTLRGGPKEVAKH